MTIDRIPENDWKLFCKVREAALERFCKQILADVAELCADTSDTAHERYLKLYRLVEERDEKIANLFNDKRRSTAKLQLLLMHREGLLTNDQLAGFSDEIRSVIEHYPF